MVRRLAGTRAGHVDSLRHSPEPLAPPACVLVGDPTSPLSIIACSVHRATTSSTSRQAPPPMSVSRMSLTGAPLKRATADLFLLVPPGLVGSILRWPPGRLGRRASASLPRSMRVLLARSCQRTRSAAYSRPYLATESQEPDGFVRSHTGLRTADHDTEQAWDANEVPAVVRAVLAIASRSLCDFAVSAMSTAVGGRQQRECGVWTVVSSDTGARPAHGARRVSWSPELESQGRADPARAQGGGEEMSREQKRWPTNIRKLEPTRAWKVASVRSPPAPPPSPRPSPPLSPPLH